MEKGHQPIKILYLEDLAIDAEQIARILRKANIDFEMKLVDSKAEYTTALQEFLPEIIISDHSLPSFNSLEALAILKRSGLHIPFILVTGAVSEEFAVIAMKNGVYDYILKDRLQRLPAAILSALEKFRLDREWRETERKIQESEKQYRDLIQHLPAAVYTCDANGRILLYNKAAVELWGREPQIGEEFWCGSWKIYDHDNKPISLENCPMARAMKEGKKMEGEEIIIKRQDGTIRHVAPHPSPTFNAAGVVTGATNMLIDITDRKKAEFETLTLIDRLQRKNKELKQFAYMVSHNLRAPIARILGLASIFDDNATDNKFYAEKITEAATELDDVVKDINTVVSARHAEKDQRKYVHFETKLSLVMQVLEQEIKESKAWITADFQQSEGVITVQHYLYSMMYNLLSNAIKHRLPGVPLRIHLQTTEDEKFIRLSVKDNGMGIDLMKNGEKMFGLYKRFHGDDIPGKGVGLHLVKTHAESLGGRVEVASKINEGAEFSIYFPKNHEHTPE